MKRRRLLIGISACLAVLALTALLSPREREPEYSGIPLTTWLERYRDVPNQHAEATQAIQRIGTNALPFLLRWIQYESPGWRNALNHLDTRLPSFIQNIRFLRWLLDDKAEYRADLAVDGFDVLGSEANPAIDKLLALALAEDSHGRKTPGRATACLIYVTQRFPPRDLPDRLPTQVR